ncbi:MAG: TolC family protein [Cyanobacteria bacterium J06638_20]
MEFSDALTPVGISLLLSLGATAPAIASSPEASSPADATSESALAWQVQVKQETPLWMSLLEEPTAQTSYAVADINVSDADVIAQELDTTQDLEIAQAEDPPETETEVPIDVPPPEVESTVEEDPGMEIDLDFTQEDTSFTQFGDQTEVEVPIGLEAIPNFLDFPTISEEVTLEESQAITLEQAIALAERNNPELEAARLALDRQFAVLREQQAALYPRLSLGGDLTLQEGQEQQQISRIDPFTGDVEFDEVGDDVDVILGGTVRIDYDVFTSGRRDALIDAAEGQLEFQELQIEAFLAELELSVAQSYYGLQEADERLRIFRDSLAQAEQNLQDAEALERAGVGTRFDVLQAEVEVANRQQDLINALRDQAVARRQLAQLLSIPPTINLTAADPIAVEEAWPLSLEESIVRAYRNRAELEQRLLEREISDDQRRAAIAQYGPQLSAFAQYSAQNLLNDEDNDFIDDYRIGLELSLNLFDGGASRAQARQQEVNTQIAEAEFANARDTIRFQVEQAYLSLVANDTNIETTSLNVERATESLRLARLRFQAGVGTQSDVLRAQAELTQAEVDRLEAILGYNGSLAELRRAVSNWPDDELQDVP